MLQRPRSGSWIPWLFVAFFLVVLAANATMVWIGLSTWPGLVADNTYERGLRYNRDLDAAKAQAALGWQVDYRVEPAGDGRAVLRASLLDRDGRPIDTAEIEARFVRPTSEGHDFGMRLRPRGEGRYVAELEPPLPGVWDLHLHIRRGEQRWVGEKRVFLK